MSIPSPTYDYFFTTDSDRLKGKDARFRQGTITLKQSGVTVDGKAVLPTGYQVLILLISIPVAGLLFVAILLEYVVRVPLSQVLLWEQIEEIVIDRAKSRAGVSFHLIENPKKRSSFTLKLPAGYLDHFCQAARYFVGDKVREDKVPSQNTLRNVLILLAVLIGIVALIAVLLALDKR